MKRINPNTEVAALKNTVKLKEEALAELAHDNLLLGQKLQKAGVALGEVQEKGRIAELALRGVKQLRQQHAEAVNTLRATEREVQGLRRNNANLSTALGDQIEVTKTYKRLVYLMIIGNVVASAVLYFKYWV